MSERIRAGIAGATITTGGSGWAASAHVPALRALPAYELKAVCTAHENTAKASAQAFGAALAFHDFDAMVAHPDIDLVVVCVRVPLHHELVMKALRAGKATLCEWPLGADLAQSRQMWELARERSISTMVGLQARSDPAVRHARELVREGYIGDLLAANLRVFPGLQAERGPGRIWQGIRGNGANPLTIPGGHSMDSLRFVAGEDFVELTARLATRVKQWRNSDTGASVGVDAPDVVSVAGQLQGGAEVSIQVATVPTNACGFRLDLFGRKGALSLVADSANRGPNILYSAQGRASMTQMSVPARFEADPGIRPPPGDPANVARAYIRLARALSEKERVDPDFGEALHMHRVIEAIERSAAEGRAMRPQQVGAP
ncbi:MAG: Gfo/Idh/MocA family oxidoreductase [Burkholderiales bacterium]|nr:Gfo/Idh/MocA family oxidoreductase [Burkholderiales bacterium]